MREVEGNTTTFYKGEESCHLIQYYAVDKLGNEELLNWQCVFVDNTPPLSVKEHGTPLIPDLEFDWVSTETEIKLDCEDQEPHPVEQETLCYKVSLDDTGLEYITEKYCDEYGGDMNDEEYCCVYVGEESINTHVNGNAFYFHFLEETYHNLEYYCVDHLGNDERTLLGGPNIQYYKVDDTPPETTKTIDPEPYTEKIGDNIVEWIDTANEITLRARDDVGPHDSGIDKIWYMNVIDLSGEACWIEEACQPVTGIPSPYARGSECIDFFQEVCDDIWQEDWNSWEGCVEYFAHDECDVDPLWKLYDGTPIQKEGESCHLLNYFAVDNLGNVEDLNVNCFFVDKEPPRIEKWYDEPFFEDEFEKEGYWAEWVNSSTPIGVEVWDPEPHPSGIDEVFYRTTIVNDEYCRYYFEDDDFECEDAEGAGSWLPGEEEFSFRIPEESCNLIEITAVDNVGKNSTHKQCVFVDNQPPTPVKEVAEPKEPWDGLDANFYDLEVFCQEPGNCWKVTLDTEISMTCSDPLPHPVDHEIICFNVELDGDDWTEDYCGEYDGEYNESGEGYCCLDRTIEDFYFLEPSEHNLKFYCEDALGNKGDTDDEKFKVEGHDFEIELNKKWNLISVPVVLMNDDPEVVFEGMECVDTIWSYDAADGWSVFTPGDAPDNLRIMPGYGYWVLAKEDCTLTIGGSLLSPGRTPPSRNLVPGWNLIGYYGLDGQEGYYGPDGNGRDAYSALYSLTSGEYGFPKWNSLYGYWETDKPQFEGYSSIDNLDPGAGYWISMKDNQQEYIYSPSTTCDGIFDCWF
jgi:hypothetical protein